VWTCDESRKSGVWFGGALSRCMEALANLSNIEWADGSRGVLK
jgi:hypothetical protein